MLERNIPLKDQHIICIDCRAQFLFDAGEQQYFTSKGLSSTPKRCSQCRLKRKLTLVREGGKV